MYGACIIQITSHFVEFGRNIFVVQAEFRAMHAKIVICAAIYLSVAKRGAAASKFRERFRCYPGILSVVPNGGLRRLAGGLRRVRLARPGPRPCAPLQTRRHVDKEQDDRPQ
jgi:hypothetical protein